MFEIAPLARVWQGQKQRPSRTADTKNAPGKDYPSKITHRQDQDFNEIHVDDNDEVLLYNVKTDAWDIKGSTDDIPFYNDGNGIWGFNYKTSAWDVPVAVYSGGDPVEEFTDVNPEVTG